MAGPKKPQNLRLPRDRGGKRPGVAIQLFISSGQTQVRPRVPPKKPVRVARRSPKIGVGPTRLLAPAVFVHPNRIRTPQRPRGRCQT